MRYFVALICLFAAGADLLHAEYKPDAEPKKSSQVMLQKGQSALMALPMVMRDALISERLGLVFLENGYSAYTGDIRTYDDGICPSYALPIAAQFIASNGKKYDYYRDAVEGRAVRDWAKMRTFYTANWHHAKRSLGLAGDEPLLALLNKEVTSVVQQAAKYHLSMLPPDIVEAWLAQLSGFIFMTDGSSPYADLKEWPRQGTVNLHQQIEWRDYKPGAKFINSEGIQYDLDEMWKAHNWSMREKSALEIAEWCVSLVGAKDIQAMFPKEVKVLNNNSKVRLQLINNVKCANVAKTLKHLPRMTREAAAAAVLGLAFMPDGAPAYESNNLVKPDAHFMGSDGVEHNFREAGQQIDSQVWDDLLADMRAVSAEKAVAAFAGDIAIMRSLYDRRIKDGAGVNAESLTEFLRQLPQSVRQALIAKYYEFVYKADGRPAFDEKKWVHFGALYMGADGVEYDFHTERHRVDNSLWSKALADINTLGMEQAFPPFSQEIEIMRRLYRERSEKIANERCAEVERLLKQIPQLTREAAIAEFYDLVYMPNGDYPFEKNGWVKGTSRFIGSDGVEHDFWDSLHQIHGTQWNELVQGIASVGADKAFAAFAKDVKTMRKRYKNR